MPERVRVILNGDDYGYSRGVNQGIEKSIQEGILTSTSVMVNRSAAEEAIKLVRNKEISIGLHLDLTKEGIQRWMGLLYIFAWSPAKIEEAFYQQIDRFKTITGQAPHHIDGHHNVHLHPRVKPFVVNYARENNIPVRSLSGAKFVMSFYGRSLRHWNDLNNVSFTHLISVLSGFKPGIYEIMCHPGFVDDELKSSGTTYLLQREAEVRALTDPGVKEYIASSRLELMSWKDLPLSY